jgi:hypothetical protein
MWLGRRFENAVFFAVRLLPTSLLNCSSFFVGAGCLAR